MQEPLQPGLVGEAQAVVAPNDLASALGSGSLDVYGTPAMLALVERAAVSAVADFLAPEATTVGTHLNVRDIAASPLGISVRARAELTAVEGRRLLFQVEAFDATEKIAEGTHERALVDGGRLLARANGKLTT